MSRPILTISPVALALALLSSTPLAAQSVPGGHASRIGSCDPRTDVGALPPGGGALHYINTSGSFVMNGNLFVGPGQTGIAIGPNASSVTLDGNGFSITGDPSLTSNGIVCPPSPVQRESVRIYSVTLESDLDGTGISNVNTVSISGGSLYLMGGRGMHFTDCGSVQVEGVSFSQCVTGIESSSVSSLELSGCVLIYNGTAISACGQSSRFTDVVVHGGSNGIVCDHSCLGPASAEPTTIECNKAIVEYVLLIGLIARRTSPGPVHVNLDECAIGSSAQDGVSIDVHGPLDLSLSKSNISDNGGDGLRVRNGNNVTVTNNTISGDLIIRNGGKGVSITSTGSVQGSSDGLITNDNGGDGLIIIAGVSVGYTYARGVASRNAGNGATITSSGDVALLCWGSNFSDNNGKGIQVTSGSSPGVKGSVVSFEQSICHGNGSDGCNLNFSSSSRSGHFGWVQLSVDGNAGSGMVVNNASVTGESGECSHNGVNGLQAQLSDIKCNLFTCNSNGGDGFNLVNSSADLSSCRALHNSGDGIDFSSALVGSSTSLSISQCELSDNQQFGLKETSGTVISHANVTTAVYFRNISGGILVQSCGTNPVTVSGCTFVSNGGVACDIQGASGGVVSQCVFSGSPTGLHLGDVTGGGCCTGVLVSDNRFNTCGNGINVDAGGHHLVVRNVASNNTINFAVGTGNMFGPVVTGADPGTNPNANYAP